MLTMGSGAGCSTTPSNRRRWRVILPIVNLALAVCLLVIGHYQHRSIPFEWNTSGTQSAWAPGHQGQLVPATQVAYAINFPALLFARPFKPVDRLVFLCALVIVWYVIGRLLDSGPHPRRKSTAIAALSLMGLLVSLVGIWSAWRVVGTHYLIPPFGALLWSVALGAYCLSVLRNAVAARS
jgi:hypothetical protein